MAKLEGYQMTWLPTDNDLGSNDGSEEQTAVVLSDSDDDLPAIVTIGRDAPSGPSQRGIKRKSTELGTRKAATVSRMFSFLFPYACLQIDATCR
jgi:hypothetical protein